MNQEQNEMAIEMFAELQGKALAFETILQTYGEALVQLHPDLRLPMIDCFEGLCDSLSESENSETGASEAAQEVFTDLVAKLDAAGSAES